VQTLKRAVTFVAVVGAVVVAAAPGEARSPGVDGALDRALQQLVEGPGGPPGAIVLVHRRGVTRVHRAGVADIARRRPWRATDHMRIASVAKAFSGAVTLSLVGSGKLHLDDTIGELIPGQPATWSQITLRQLLGHRSGLPDYTGSDAFGHDFISDPFRRFTPRELLAYAAPERLEFTPPGSRYKYSNTDNIAAALMAEAVTRKPYEQLLRLLVYKPLGLHETSLPSGPALPRPFAHGYMPNPPGPPEDVSETFSPSGAWASGGIVSTAADLGRFVRGYVSGRLFGPAVRREQRRFGPGSSEPVGPGENSAGLALFRYRLSCGTVYGHTGNIFGYTQFIAASSDGRRSATVSINQQIAPPAGDPDAFGRLRQVFELAACAALAGK
jgi:D-alanyl-D-alanine carboxypeptidase